MARTQDLRFPVAGVARRLGHRAWAELRPPYPAPWAVNVRPEDPLSRRWRGGSRPGLTKVVNGAIGTSISAILSVPVATSTGTETLIALAADGELKVLDGETVTAPVGVLLTEAGLDILTEAGDEILAGTGEVPASCVFVSRGGAVFGITSTGITLLNLSTGVVDTLTASEGTVPTGCAFGCLYRDRLVLASANAIFMSRQGDPTDWDYGADAEDSGRAVAFQLSEAGEHGGAVTALVPHRDAFLLAATRNSLWAVQGDPGAAGTLRNVSRDVGVLGPETWCKAGESILFLAEDGLYRVGASGEGLENLSEDRLPEELRDINLTLATPMIGYSHEERGVHLFLPTVDGDGAAVDVDHWFFDLVNRGFWPDAYDADHVPQAICRHEGTLFLAGADGYLRELGGDDDDGTAIASHLLLGPIRPGRANDFGMILNLHGITGAGSGTVTWRIVTGDTAEEAAENAKAAIEAFQAGGSYTNYVKASGTWTAGRSLTAYPRTRAMWVVLWLQAAAPWAYEGVTLETDTFGRWR